MLTWFFDEQLNMKAGHFECCVVAIHLENLFFSFPFFVSTTMRMEDPGGRPNISPGHKKLNPISFFLYPVEFWLCGEKATE